MAKKPRQQSKQQPNINAAVRDLLKHAINNGAAMPIGFFLIMALMIYNLPPNNKHQLLMQVLKLLDNLCGLAWFFLFIILILWPFHSILRNREHLRELDRIGREKSWLQEKLIGKPLASSNDPIKEEPDE